MFKTLGWVTIVSLALGTVTSTQLISGVRGGLFTLFKAAGEVEVITDHVNSHTAEDKRIWEDKNFWER